MDEALQAKAPETVAVITQPEPKQDGVANYNQALKAAMARLPSSSSVNSLVEEVSSDEDILGSHRKQEQQRRQKTEQKPNAPAVFEDEGLRQRSKTTTSEQSRRGSASSNDSADYYLSYRRQGARGGSKSGDAQPTTAIAPLRYHLLRNASRGLRELFQFDDWDSGIAHTLLEPTQGYWLDIQKPSLTDMRLLAKRLPIDESIISAILSNDYQEQANFLEHLLHVCIRMTVDDEDNHVSDAEEGFVIMLIFPKVLVTLHNDALVSVRSVMEGVKRSHYSINPERILYLLLLENLRLWTPVVNAAEDDVEALHDLTVTLGTKDKDDALLRMSSTRGRLSQIQRRFLGKRDVLRSISTNAFPYLATSGQPYLRDTLEQLNDLLRTITLARDSLNQLQANYLAKISMDVADENKETNKSIKLFSLVATIGLPVNSLSGIGGMNIYYPGRIEETNSPQAVMIFVFLKIFLAFMIVILFTYMKLF